MFGTSLPKETLKDIEKEVGGMERSLKFDIFSGTVDKNAFWLERVEGLENAKRRMEEIATKWPERYFLFCDFSHTVVAQIDGASEIPSEEKAVWLSEVDKPKGISGGGCYRAGASQPRFDECSTTSSTSPARSSGDMIAPIRRCHAFTSAN